MARLGDARSSCQCVDAVVEEIQATSSCCLPPGTVRCFKERSTDLRSAEARKWDLCWAMSKTTSLVDTERMHARNLLKILSFVADPPHEVCLLGSGVFCHGGLAKPSCCIDDCHSAVDEPDNSYL